MRRLLVPAIALAILTPAAGASAAGSVVVRPGETLSAIAARAGVGTLDLARANGIADPDRVRAGRVLVLPGPSGTAPAASPVAGGGAGDGGTHRLRAGETLSAVAARAGVSVGALARANGIADPDLVRAGMVLRIPDRVAAPAAGAAPAPSPTSGGRRAVAALIDREAAARGVDPALARAVAWQESGHSQSVVSSAGAVGVMQLMPGTASWVGRTLLGRRIDPSVVEDNVAGGVAYLRWLIDQTGSTRTAVAAYYEGLGAVRRDGPLPETRRYVAHVMALYGRV